MVFYLRLALGWCAVAVAAAILMGRFIDAGKGALNEEASTFDATERVTLKQVRREIAANHRHNRAA
jgi:hypothetical protein